VGKCAIIEILFAWASRFISKRKQEEGAVQQMGCAWRGKLLADTYRRSNTFDAAYKIAREDFDACKMTVQE